jgi:hypothetical protein
MAVRHSSRKGVRTRNPGRNPRGTKSSGDTRSVPDAVYTYLRELTPALRLALCASSAATMALSYQAAERDEEVATVLDRCCCFPLLIELDKLQKLLPRLETRKPITPPTPHRSRYGGPKG